MTRATLQQERSRATRKAIMAAALKLWQERGFAAASVEDVCNAAEVAKGSFYFYFPSKEHLLVMLLFARITPKEAELTALLNSGLDTLGMAIHLVSTIHGRVSRIQKALVHAGVSKSFQHYQAIVKLEGGDRSLRWYYRPIYDRGLERGEIEPWWDVETMAMMSSWVTLQGMLLWSDGRISDEDFLPNLRSRIELIVNGATTARRAMAAAPPKRARLVRDVR